MEKIFRIFSKESININQAALVLGFFTLLSQILALFRDRSIAYFIGPSSSLDVYYAAFRVPDLIFICIASLASVTVLIPFLVAKMPARQSAGGKGEEVTEESQKFLNDIFTIFFIIIVAVSFVAFLLMPFLVSIIAPGFTPFFQKELIILSRIMLLSPILLGLSNLFGTVTQLFRKFFIYALSPIFYNLGIIVGVTFFYRFFGIYGLALGVAFGALMHFIIQAIASSSCGFTPRFSLPFLSINFKDIKSVVITSLPRTLGLAFNNIALIAIISLASFLKSGSISIFNFAFNLQSVPLNIIGISYAVAAFPTLAKSVSMGKMDEFKNHLKSAARQIVFWSFPVIFLFIVVRAQIVRVILGSGSFSWESTRLVAACLANFSCSILIVFLSFFFTFLFQNVSVFRFFIESILKVSDIPGTEVLMLPLAYSVGTILNSILLWFFVRRDFMKGESFITKTFFQSLGASFFLGLTAYIGLNILSPIFGTTTFWGVFLQGFISGIAGIFVAILVLHLLQNEELKDLQKVLKTKFWKAVIIAPPQEEL